EDISRELACFREHCLNHVVGKVAVKTFRQRRAETSRVLERKGNIGNRRPVGHRLVSGWAAFIPRRTASSSCDTQANPPAGWAPSRSIYPRRSFGQSDQLSAAARR